MTHLGDDLFTELGYMLGNKVAAEDGGRKVREKNNRAWISLRVPSSKLAFGEQPVREVQALSVRESSEQR